MTNDPDSLTLPEHTIALGKIVTNLLSLEGMLRLFLSSLEAREGLPQASLGEMFRATAGQEFEECPLTDYDSLAPLIKRYNERLEQLGPRTENLEISGAEIVRLRDAIAHGRILSSEATPPLWLFKFSKPDNGKVRLEIAERLTTKWFRDNVRRLYEEMGALHGLVWVAPEMPVG